jgi:tetratricopeptide (TPR) repeat protein
LLRDDAKLFGTTRKVKVAVGIGILGAIVLAPFSIVAASNGGLSEAELRFNAGVDLQQQGCLEEAIAEYGEAIQLDSQLAVAFNNRGSVYMLLNQYQLALGDLSQAIALSPQDFGAYSLRAVVYTFLKMDTEAEADIERAVQLGVGRATMDQVIEAAKSLR